MNETPMLRADDLLRPFLPRERVEVPELGGHVWIRAMTGRERDEWEIELIPLQRGGDRRAVLRNMRARLVARTACDAEGAPLFSPAQAEDLGAQNALVLDRLYDVAERLSGLRAADEREAAGNSETAGGASSSS